MKNRIIGLLVIVLSVGVLTGCTSSTSDKKSADSSTNSSKKVTKNSSSNTSSSSSSQEPVVDAEGNEKVASPEEIRGTWYGYNYDGTQIDTISIDQYSMQTSFSGQANTTYFYRNPNDASFQVQHEDWGRALDVNEPAHGLHFFNIRGWQQTAGDGQSYAGHTEDGQAVLVSASGAGYWTDAVYFKTEALAKQYKGQKFADLVYQ